MTMRMVMCALMLLGLAGFAVANDGIIPSDNPRPSGYADQAREELMDEWNAAEAHVPAGTYTGGCYALVYEAPFDYVLERVEFLAGGVAGPAAVQVRADSYDGPVLGEVSYNEVAETSWQGANLEPAVLLTAGATYSIVYMPAPDSDASTAAGGDIVLYYWAQDCTVYGDVVDYIYWKARFYGGDVVAADESTWSAVKGLYR